MSHKSGQSDARGGGRSPLVLGGIAAVCIAGTAWMLWPSGGAKPEPGTSAFVPKVLCSSCRFQADAKSVALDGDGAVAPALGPGYKCPKCGKRTLYTNPYICKKCRTPFLGQPDGTGNFVGKCPKCGTVD